MSLAAVDRPTLAVAGLAAGVWAGAVGGRWWGWPGLLVAVPFALLAANPDRRTLAWIGVALVVVGWWSGASSTARQQAILDFPTLEGPVDVTVRLTHDVRQGPHGWWALAVADPPEAGRPPSIPMLLSFEQPPSAVAGERIRVEGRRSGRRGSARGKPYSGVIVVDSAVGAGEGSLWWVAGNRVRERALERLRGGDAARALLAGFLVGETGGLSESDLEAMRRSGLMHLVAVSGSNVSLFLTLAFVASGPLGAGPRRRAVVGLVAIVVLVVATRWEPSVVRASLMAALVLGGRVAGWAPNVVTALSVTVIVVVVVSGEMATDVGFAMSVFATLGVLVGSRVPWRSLPRPLATVAGATLGAQLAVAPVVLAVFGSIPLLAPLANLAAVPVVSVTTALGAVAVAVGSEFLIDLAGLGAAFVLGVARVASTWPQVGWAGFALAAGAVAVASVPRWRPLAALVGAVAVAAVLVQPPNRLVTPSAVFFDVGQGDSILVVASGGEKMLVDGGPDAATLEAKLSGLGVGYLDLVVLTHAHADHAAGLEAVLGRRGVGAVWLPTPPHTTPALERLEELVQEHRIPVTTPPVGQTVQLGDLTISVLAPVRRYASPNDQSTVLQVTTPGGPDLLLTGDIETHAQADLSGLRADILKVPHQGGATSDLGWLVSLGAAWAIVSVGENDFGHPSDQVLAALEEAGARISRTDLEGDIVVPLAAHHVDWDPVSLETPSDVPG